MPTAEPTTARAARAQHAAAPARHHGVANDAAPAGATEDPAVAPAGTTEDPAVAPAGVTEEPAVPPAAGGGAAPRQRLDSLDGIRGLAALGVLVLHVWMFSYGDSHRPPKGLLDFTLGELRLGVQVFFVLSGFLIFRPFVAAALDGARRGPSLARYAIRRAARILPGYWVALIASFFLLRHLDHPMQIDPALLPVFLVFAQNHFEETIRHLDPPMWTLAIEVSFYATLPLAGLAALKLGAHRVRLLALTLTIVAAGVVSTILAYTHHWPQTLSTSLLPHLVEFGAGMTVAVLLHGRRLSARQAAPLVLAGLAVVVANSWWHATGVSTKEIRSLVGDAPGIAGIAMVIATLVAGPWRATLLARGPAKWLGTISYGVYLFHFPVIVGLRMTGHWPEGDVLGRQLLTVMAITLPAATLSWFLVEKPAIAWARRVTGGGRRRAARAPQPQPKRQRTGESPALRPQPAGADTYN
ncbi:O-acetyltransferase [Baekduia alba]|uniref:acyltransferase family protein n=1 Tax=Baekduia alba TaxID=2997333 RepID=UPI00234177A2|nr:acyltransferase [Baekduia alba]WCB92921.1 O-acetyltransferase [Baekduia alba]